MKRLILIAMAIFISFPLFAEKIAVLPEVVKPERLTVDGNRIYITGNRTVYMYDLKRDGLTYLKQFIKRGEGPSEAPGSIFLISLPEVLPVSSKGKVMLFSKDGDYISEKKIPTIISRVSPIGHHFIGLTQNLDDKTVQQYESINLYDKDFNSVKTLIKGRGYPLYSAKKGKKKKNLPLIVDNLFYDISDEKIVIADSRTGFSIAVFDLAGKPLYRINKDYEKIKVPDSFRENWINRMMKKPYWKTLSTRLNPVIPEYYPAIYYFWVSNGKIYAFTWKEKKDDSLRELVVLETKGKELKRMFLPGDALKSSIDHGKFYYLVENEEDEVWELHIQKIFDD